MQRYDSEPIAIGDFELIALKVGGDMLMSAALMHYSYMANLSEGHQAVKTCMMYI